jgi:chromosome segregation ATPase
MNAGVSKEDLMKRIAELEEAIRKITAENEELRNRKANLKLSIGTLNENLHLLTEETQTVESARNELSTQLLELEEKYSSERSAFEEQLKMLSDQIKMSSATSEDQQTQLQNQIEGATRDRDALIEELRKLREGLQQENEEMSKKNQALGRKLVDLKKTRENLELELCSKQEKEGKLVNDLRKRLLQHVYDMHNWKVFLEQDKEYDSEGLHIVMEGVLADLSFKEQVVTLENAIQEETDILIRLYSEQKAGHEALVAASTPASAVQKASSSSGPKKRGKK